MTHRSQFLFDRLPDRDVTGAFLRRFDDATDRASLESVFRDELSTNSPNLTRHPELTVSIAATVMAAARCAFNVDKELSLQRHAAGYRRRRLLERLFAQVFKKYMDCQYLCLVGGRWFAAPVESEPRMSLLQTFHWSLHPARHGGREGIEGGFAWAELLSQLGPGEIESTKQEIKELSLDFFVQGNPEDDKDPTVRRRTELRKAFGLTKEDVLVESPDTRPARRAALYTALSVRDPNRMWIIGDFSIDQARAALVVFALDPKNTADLLGRLPSDDVVPRLTEWMWSCLFIAHFGTELMRLELFRHAMQKVEQVFERITRSLMQRLRSLTEGATKTPQDIISRRPDGADGRLPSLSSFATQWCAEVARALEVAAVSVSIYNPEDKAVWCIGSNADLPHVFYVEEESQSSSERAITSPLTKLVMNDHQATAYYNELGKMCEMLFGGEWLFDDQRKTERERQLLSLKRGLFNFFAARPNPTAGDTNDPDYRLDKVIEREQEFSHGRRARMFAQKGPWVFAMQPFPIAQGEPPRWVVERRAPVLVVQYQGIDLSNAWVTDEGRNNRLLHPEMQTRLKFFAEQLTASLYLMFNTLSINWRGAVRSSLLPYTTETSPAAGLPGLCAQLATSLGALGVSIFQFMDNRLVLLASSSGIERRATLTFTLTPDEHIELQRPTFPRLQEVAAGSFRVWPEFVRGLGAPHRNVGTIPISSLGPPPFGLLRIDNARSLFSDLVGQSVQLDDLAVTDTDERKLVMDHLLKAQNYCGDRVPGHVQQMARESEIYIRECLSRTQRDVNPDVSSVAQIDWNRWREQLKAFDPKKPNDVLRQAVLSGMKALWVIAPSIEAARKVLKIHRNTFSQDLALLAAMLGNKSEVPWLDKRPRGQKP